MRFQIINVSAILVLASTAPCLPGGLIGDLINNVVPGAGTALDEAHRQIKNAIPPYKALEEGATHAVNEAFVQAGAPALVELIARSRDDALRRGVDQIPPDIRANLTGFIADNLLNAVRYRVGGGGDLTLQVNAIRYGEAAAITLDYVVVFKEENDALYNPTLWAHELTHVGQYQSWGIHDFAVRYLRSYSDVERPAYEAETRYAAWVATRNSNQVGIANGPANANLINRPVAPFAGAGASNTCGTVLGICGLPGSAPVGTACWCGTPAGPVTGSVTPPPQDLASSAPVGLPSGFAMTACGCWGLSPPFVAPEPRCASQAVLLPHVPLFAQRGVNPMAMYATEPVDGQSVFEKGSR
jgi:hypothetical protein